MERTYKTTKSRLAQHPEYSRIITAYNTEFNMHEGKVNNLKFYNEVIKPIYPEYHLQSWYQFIRSFKTATGLQAAQGTSPIVAPFVSASPEEKALLTSLLSNKEATDTGISHALNLGSEYYVALMKKYKETPELLLPFEHKILSDALFKAMKAQDSRIHAIGKVREDAREEEKLNRAFKDAAFE